MSVSPEPTTTSSSSSLPPFERCGVSLSFLKMFQQQYLSSQPDNHALSTTDVCNTIIIPATKEQQCAFVDLFRDKQDADGKPFVAKATVFVSHAWKYKVAEPFDVMLEHGEQYPDSYFWFDLFTNNQHRAASLPQEWWKTTFRNAIAEIGHVVLVMSPWDNPIPVTRAWCLWEILSALDQQHVQFTVKFPRSIRQHFFDRILHDSKSVLGALAKIQAEKAEAFRKEDLNMIFTAINATIGFRKMNVLVNTQIRSWYVETAAQIADELVMAATDDDAKLRTTVDRAGTISTQSSAQPLASNALVTTPATAPATAASNARVTRCAVQFPMSAAFTAVCDAEKSALALRQVGSIFSDFGDHDRAIQYFLRSLAILERTFGSKAPQLVTCLADLGTAYCTKGEYDRALTHLERSRTIVEKTFGSNHVEMAKVYMHLGQAHHRKTDYPVALKHYESALKIRRKQLGDTDPLTTAVYQAMAETCMSQGDFHKALDMYQQAMQAGGANISDGSDSGLAVAFENLARVYDKMGDPGNALNFYQGALTMRHDTLGDYHPATARSCLSVASCWQKLDSVELALLHFEQALDIQERCYGTDHPDIAMTCAQISRLHEQEGDLDQALQYCQRCLDIQETLLGSNHPDTAGTYGSLGALHTKQGQYEQALGLFNKSLACFQSEQHSCHLGVAVVLNLMGDMFSLQSEFGQALDYHNRALAHFASIQQPDHEDIINTRLKIAQVFVANSEYSRALEEYQRVYASLQRFRGDDHAAITSVLTKVADTYALANHHENACNYYSRAHELCLRVYGPQCSDTISARDRLAKAQEELNKYPQHENSDKRDQQTAKQQLSQPSVGLDDLTIKSNDKDGVQNNNNNGDDDDDGDDGTNARLEQMLDSIFAGHATHTQRNPAKNTSTKSSSICAIL